MGYFWQGVSARVLSELFGDGLGADIAGRGTVFLADEVRKSLDPDEQRLTSVRLRPGESYSILVRPPATRAERRLAASQAHLRARDEHLSRPHRRQIKAARKLAKSQRRLDRRRPGSRRHAKAEQRERELAERFDRVMAPSKRHRAVRRDLDEVTRRLEESREASLERVRGGRVHRIERPRVFE